MARTVGSVAISDLSAAYFKNRNKREGRNCLRALVLGGSYHLWPKKSRKKVFAKFFRSFCEVFSPRGRPHAQNKKSGRSRSLCCQIFSSVRRLELKKVLKNKSCGKRQTIDKRSIKIADFVKFLKICTKYGFTVMFLTIFCSRYT